MKRTIIKHFVCNLSHDPKYYCYTERQLRAVANDVYSTYPLKGKLKLYRSVIWTKLLKIKEGK